MSAARKQRAYRQRQRAGLAVYPVPLADKVLVALMAAGRVTEADMGNRDLVGREIQEVLNEWADRWLK